jgi:hypothetical protein
MHPPLMFSCRSNTASKFEKSASSDSVPIFNMRMKFLVKIVVPPGKSCQWRSFSILPRVVPMLCSFTMTPERSVVKSDDCRYSTETAKHTNLSILILCILAFTLWSWTLYSWALNLPPN